MPDSSEVRDRILCEATRLFGTKGFSATSVREVVAAAGVTKPTLYYHFGNKEALFAEAVNAQLAGLGMLIDGVVHGDGSLRERLERFLEIYVRGALEHPESVRLIMTATAPTDASQPRVQTIERFRGELRRLAEAVQQGVKTGELHPELDADMAILMLIGGADVLLLHGLAGHPVPDDFARRLTQTLFQGFTS